MDAQPKGVEGEIFPGAQQYTGNAAAEEVLLVASNGAHIGILLPSHGILLGCDGAPVGVPWGPPGLALYAMRVR